MPNETREQRLRARWRGAAQHKPTRTPMPFTPMQVGPRAYANTKGKNRSTRGRRALGRVKRNAGKAGS